MRPSSWAPLCKAAGDTILTLQSVKLSGEKLTIVSS